MSYTLHRNVRIKRDEKEDQRSQQRIDKWIFYILITAIIFIPLLIGGHVTEVVSPLIADVDRLISGGQIDFFTFYKFIALVTLTIAAVCLFLYKLFFLNYFLPKRPILWFFTIFLVAVLLSTILSPNKSIALLGQYNRSDGGISYICYILLMFVAMHIKYPKKVIEYVLYSFYPLVIVNFILTTMNFTGHDALTYSLVKNAMTAFSPEIVIGDNSKLIGTLNHWNYMSGMFALVTVMYLSWIVIDTNKLRRLINLVAALLSFTTMLIGMSSSGFVTFVCITPLVLWIAIRSTNKKMAFISLAIFYVLALPVFHVLSVKDPKVWDESVGFFLPENPYVVELPKDTSLKEINDWHVSKFFFSTVFAADAAFTLPELPKNAWGPGTGRIYIWQKTLQLVSERPLFGYGLDTLIYNFPHYDIEAQGNLNELTIVDKPHNLYVGIVYGTGIIGLFGFLGIVFNIVWVALKKIFSYNKLSSLTIVLCVTWLAFLFQALFNDSLPGTTTPVFIIGGIIMGLIYNDKEALE
ncbi:O-antigen ligase family protein [Psychrobacillus glaciei]|uniref:O-antigen ligase family protein n=1 Tax=Psychrobacillus glaciei TaxID=2283160 RepID=A0A5J6SJC7_9BACI|nr:O-antigen ligase family protein [Psychrobacillus glaciei]QFF97981.1 O-antigen ligase family protein [Psychrobacillus glaciei]